MSNNIETISKVYEAFGKGDIPTILTYIADNVQWENWEDKNTGQQAGVPWLQARKGKEGVLEFFKAVGGAMKFNEFNVKSMMAGGNQVAVELVIDAEILTTGERLKDEEMHLWTFDAAGKIVSLRHYVDTAKHMQATHMSMPSLV